MKMFRFIILFTVLANHSMAQEAVVNFVVVTLERERSWDVHEAEYSYWIIRADSLERAEVNLRPLYLRGFSKNNFESCCSFDSLTMFLSPGTSFDFEAQYLSQLDELSLIIKKSGKLVQTVRKKWNDGPKEQINVFLTPISGSFCQCRVGSKGVKIDGISSVVIPRGNFQLNEKIWSNNLLKQFKHYDFSDLKFIDFRSIL